MPAFDSAIFDGTAFDSGGASGPPPAVPVGTGSLTASLAVTVGSGLVFNRAIGGLRWAVRVMVGGVDISARLMDVIRISGREDEARIASFSVRPVSSAQLLSLDAQPVTIDIILQRGSATSTIRRFTGQVESVEFNSARRIATVDCRDAWQEIFKACQTAESVESLFGGLAKISPLALPWNAAKPDAGAYFSGLLATIPGATAIDSRGIWHAFPWQTASPAAIFAEGDVMSDSVKIRRASRRDLPKSINVRLSHRFHRLHNISVPLQWSAPTYLENIDRGLELVPKSTVISAIDGIADWYVQGKATIEQHTPGLYQIPYQATLVDYMIDYTMAQTTIKSLAGWMYRRWYQEVDASYTASIDVGGLSERSADVSASIASDFDADAWERPSSAENSLGLYVANVPAPPAGPTGYEALPAPWPPFNSSVDHYGSAADIDLADAFSHVLAKGLRQASAGRRSQTVSFSRVLDPRWEIGDVLGISAYGVAATGQISEFDETLDMDSGEATTEITLACPDGNAQTTSFTVGFSPILAVEEKTITHAPLTNHYGAASDTVYIPPGADLDVSGLFVNVSGVSSWYLSSAPIFNQQFRVVMPEIPAIWRDPITPEKAFSPTFNIAGSGITVVF